MFSSCFWLPLLLRCFLGVLARSTEESPIVNVTSIMEDEVLLPCDISTNIEDDQPVLIMFYRNSSGTPIYTVDMRRQSRAHPHHMPSSALINRAEFDLREGKSGLYLKSVWSTDDGLYRCRVDFRTTPTRNSRINLTVIVPPDSVRIVDETGEEKSSTIGPFVLGQSLMLKCVAHGGRPPPTLTWSVGNKDIQGTVSITPDEVSSTLEIHSLQRHHLHQSFICQASNAELAVPVTAAVTVDMTLPPMLVKLEGIDGPVSAGVGVSVRCIVIGARPQPEVTWWLDGRPLKASNERGKDSGNVTESVIVLVPRPDHQGKHLTCRAETPRLVHATVEKEIRLTVHYVPEVTVTLGPSLNLRSIKEGDEVYFTCSTMGVPPPTAIHWYHNNVQLIPNSYDDDTKIQLNANNTGGVIMNNMSLVLQHVGRHSSGSYTCRATNTEGEGRSQPLHLDVKYAPVCRADQRWVYGIARNEMVHVSCSVEAHPAQLTFRWVFNNSGETTDIPEAHILNNGTRSMVTYTPITEMDYGVLLCWAQNSVGMQREPCVYKIFPAGPPDRLKNCTVLNESKDSVQVRCREGFDGGLSQSFVMEVYETKGHKLKSNVTSKAPSFTVRGLPSGLALTVRIYAANGKGRSELTELAASTLSDVAEKHVAAGVIPASELPSTMELYPSLAIILGVVGGILVVFAVIVGVMVVRRPRRENGQGAIQQDDSSMHILKKDNSNSGRLDMDEKDPDVIPDTRGSRADLTDRRGVADVSSLYGEMCSIEHDHAHIHAHNEQMVVPPPPISPPPPAQYLSSPPPPNQQQQPQQQQQQQPPQQPQSPPPPPPPPAQQQQQQQQPPPPPPPPQQPPQDLACEYPQHSVVVSTNNYHLLHQAPAPTYTHALPPGHSQVNMAALHTHTLPHPRHASRHAHATLQRRGSQFMELPVTTIAPPPPYGSPPTLLSPDMMGGAVVPMVAETIRITPNATHAHAHAHGQPILPPPEQYPPLPTSFGSDRMESAV